MSHFNAKQARGKRPLPWWFDAFVRDTLHLQADEIGAYMMLLGTMWTNESCDLPDDDRRLAIAARVSLRLWKARIGPTLRPFFTAEDGCLFSKRLREEAAYVERQVTHQHDRKVGVKSDKSLNSQDQASTADASPDEPRNHPSQQPNNLHKDSPPPKVGTTPPREAPRPAQGEEGKDDLTDRERVLALLGCDPASGIHKADLKTRGYPRDTDELNRWKASGLTMEEILGVIEERLKAVRARPDTPPTWAPDRFSFFTGMMQDKLRAKQAPPLTATSGSPASADPNDDPQLRAWKKRLAELQAEEAADAAARAERAAKAGQRPIH